jgi:hypothetical protein
MSDQDAKAGNTKPASLPGPARRLVIIRLGTVGVATLGLGSCAPQRVTNINVRNPAPIQQNRAQGNDNDPNDPPISGRRQARPAATGDNDPNDAPDRPRGPTRTLSDNDPNDQPGRPSVRTDSDPVDQPTRGRPRRSTDSDPSDI